MKRLLQDLAFSTLAVLTAARWIPIRPDISSPVEGEVISVGNERIQEPKATGPRAATGPTNARRHEQLLVPRDVNHRDDATHHPHHGLDARAERTTKPTSSTLKPRYPTRQEMEAVLDADQLQVLNEARAGLRTYHVALRAAEAAEAIGRKLTEVEQKQLEYGQNCAADYARIRHQALKLVALSENGPTEVFLKYQQYLGLHREESQRWLAELTPQQREWYNERKKVSKRIKKAARDDRIEELEKLAKDRRIGKAGRQELKELRAKRDKEIANRKLHDVKRKPIIQAEAAEAQAAKAALKARINDGTATVEDQQKWAEMEANRKQANARRTNRRNYIKELERIIKDPAGGATEEQKKEWREYVARGDIRRGAVRAKKKVAGEEGVQGQGEDDVNDVRGDDVRGDDVRGAAAEGPSSHGGSSHVEQSSTNQNHPPSTGGPLQFSADSRRASSLRQSSWLAHAVQHLPRVRHQIPRIASMRPRQLNDLLHHGWQFISTAVRDHNWQRQLIAAPRGPIPAGVRVPV